MSYDIYFIKKRDLSINNVYEILETTESKPENEIFISRDLMKSLIELLKSEELEFEIFEGENEDYFELNFPTYQIGIFNSQLAISLPYWDENSNDGINNEIKQITNILLKNNFIGFDPQTEEFIRDPYKFQKTFIETMSVVENHWKTKSKSQQSERNISLYFGIGFGLIIIGLIVWKLIK